MKSISSTLIALVLTLLLTACAAPGPQPGSMEIRTGVIEQISAAQIASNHHQGLGAIVGGLGGLGIGSLIGAGTGRDVAMAVGAIGGAVIGNEVQKKNDQPVAAQQIIVRLSSGVLVQIIQPLGPYLSVGQHVYVQGSGENARVTPQ